MDLAKILDLHQKWLNNEEGGVHANLEGTNLEGANLVHANLDFSCLPLWCGSLNMTVDRKLSSQIAYHFCSLKCEDEEVKKFQESLFEFANEFERVQDGELKKLKVEVIADE